MHRLAVVRVGLMHLDEMTVYGRMRFFEFFFGHGFVSSAAFRGLKL